MSVAPDGVGEKGQLNDRSGNDPDGSVQAEQAKHNDDDDHVLDPLHHRRHRRHHRCASPARPGLIIRSSSVARGADQIIRHHHQE